jgi:hypothetical protein
MILVEPGVAQRWGGSVCGGGERRTATERRGRARLSLQCKALSSVEGGSVGGVEKAVQCCAGMSVMAVVEVVGVMLAVVVVVSGW